jgi:rRNA processing protein Krr1/Pno1
MEKEIEIKIDSKGNITVELMNFNGNGCSSVAEKFVKALGKSVHVDKKQEFYNDSIKDCNNQNRT